ncbi:MAG: ATP-dependent zinc metalloprotease FtsH, partial [Ruminococcaceae bacterium]|nr:ATP-dependent zinc metalloprotease FtsH [Oscillospiraceae bacterium]
MKGNFKVIIFYIVLILVIVLSVSAFFGPTKQEKMVYSDIVEYFKTDSVISFQVDEDYYLTMKVVDKDSATYNENGVVVGFDEEKTKEIGYQLRSLELFHTDLEDYIATNQNLTEYEYEPQTTLPWWVSLLPYVLIIIVFIVLWIFVMNQSAGKGGKMGMGSFGKARVKTPSADKDKVLFTDVAGADEEKEELREIVEFLRDPKKFTALGAKIPHGVLLVGPPGTGKTLLAKAVAGEADVPFFSISGSDFVEMYVGVGASRVRDLFDNARKFTSSIIFIDEIDAVGRHRGAGLGGGHDEREQTLNQLLVEMDGFGSHEGIIVIAATNRPDILDPALLRPGRFDRRVTVNYPDIKGREEILHVHARKKPIEADVDFHKVAQTTVGFTGADLANLLNEAALLAAKRDKTLIGMDEINDSFMKLILGPQKKAHVRNEHDNKLTAYHEAGHAVSSYYCEHTDPVKVITIVPAGNAGGVTVSVPTEDSMCKSRSEMFESIVWALGGRVAEELIMEDISTGASSDIQHATATARNMITRYGMSDKLGTVLYGSEHSSDEVFLGRDFSSGKNYSEKTAAEIDDEIRALIDKAYKKCREILMAHKDKLEFVAQYLLLRETM